MSVSNMLKRHLLHKWRGYLIGIALSAIATLLVYLLTTFVSIHSEIIYVLAIAITAIFFGLGPAVFTSILSVIVHDYFFVPPLNTLGPRSAEDIPMLITFVIVGFIISFLGLRLRESEERFRSIVETSGEGIVIVNPSSIITYVNKRFLEMLGYSMKEVLGKSIINFAVKEYKDELVGRLENRKKGIWESYDIAYRRKNGHILWVKINGSPLFDTNGKHIASVGMHIDITEERNLKIQLEDYMKRLIQIQEDERKRIARELHDDTAPTLSLLSLELDSILAKYPHLSEEAVKRLKELQGKINHTQENIRSFSHELHPSILDNLGLGAALEALVSEVNSKVGMMMEFEVIGTERKPPDEVNLALYRIAQEAINNVRKHSRANKALVSIEFTQDKIILSITDNGVGFDTSIIRKSGLGLTGMKERAYLIGANLKIDSIQGKGTTVIVKV